MAVLVIQPRLAHLINQYAHHSAGSRCTYRINHLCVWIGGLALAPPVILYIINVFQNVHAVTGDR